MNKVLQIYLTIVATVIMLFLAAIIVLLIIVGVKVSQEVKSVDAKATDITSKIDTFNQSIKNFNPF